MEKVEWTISSRALDEFNYYARIMSGIMMKKVEEHARKAGKVDEDGVTSIEFDDVDICRQLIHLVERSDGHGSYNQGAGSEVDATLRSERIEG